MIVVFSWRILMRYFLPLTLLILCGSVSADDAGSFVFLDDGDNTGVLHTYASAEIQGYFAKMFTTKLVTEIPEGTAPDVIIRLGTPDSNTAIADAVAAGQLLLPEGTLSDQGYTLKSLENQLFVAAPAPQGVLYGAYAFLEAYGAYFQISGERLPAPLPFTLKTLDLTEKPAVKFRGLLPWDAYICGIAGYNPEDYRQLIDRAARLKLNFLQFHFYPGSAFFTETIDGTTVEPRYLGMPVDIFPTANAAGKAAFGDAIAFGAQCYIDHAGNPAAQAHAVQDMMRDALAHAKNRGMHTAVGMELMQPSVGSPLFTAKPEGSANCLDPLRPENLALSRQRYLSLKEAYPDADFYCFWQSEGQGVRGAAVGQEEGAAAMREAQAHWTSQDNYRGDIDYAWLLKQLCDSMTPEEQATTAAGGWFLQHLFPGIHPDFPAGIRFSSINNYSMEQSLDGGLDYYAVAAESRAVWVTDWWEYSGEQWFPQWRAGGQERIYRQCLDYGIEALSLVGWKLSGIEHNIRFMADFAWHPGLTAEQFYRDYVSRLYGQDSAPLADLYMTADAKSELTPPATSSDDRPMSLGEGWIALGIPPFPDTVEGLSTEEWRHTAERAAAIAAEQQAFLQSDRDAVALIGQIIPGLDSQGQYWAALLLNRLRMRAHYLESMIALNESYGIYQASAPQGMPAARAAAALRLNDAVALAGEAIEIYSKEIRNRNDLGVVAQMNVQYLQPLVQLQASLSD